MQTLGVGVKVPTEVDDEILVESVSVVSFHCVRWPRSERAS